MPLGGFCEVCDRWVWLTPYGACENGHPPTKVRDVQQLKASTSVGVAPYEGDYAPFSPAKARFRFWWRHSLWIGWTFTLGFFNWLAFVYIGIRARHAAWTIAGFAYLVTLLPDLGAFMKSPAILVLTAAVILSLTSLHFFFRKHYWVAGAALFLSVFGMVYVRHVVRMLKLKEAFDLPVWRIAPQWSPFFLFLVCFVIMLAVLAWMLWLFFSSKHKAT